MEKIIKKTIALTLFGLMCVCAVFAQAPVTLDAAIQRACSDITLKLAMGPRVALVSFHSTNDMSEHVLREMVNTLEKSRSATWISRQDTDRALTAANQRSFDDISDADARQIGRTLNASSVITGTLIQTGNTYRLRTKMIAVNNGNVQASSDIVIADNAQLKQLLGIASPAPVQTPAPAAVQAPPPAPVQTPPPAPVQTPPPAVVQTPAPAPVQAPAAPTVYRVGDRGPAGGFIFYDKGNNSDGWRYLEAAPEDLTQTMLAVTETIPDRDMKERGVGWGKKNTAGIMNEAASKGGGFGWAAQACDAYVLNGFDDWFLPSRDELNFIYGNLHMRGLGNFRNEWYWSSTSNNGYYWGAINFESGRFENQSGTYYRYRVRPVRQF